MAGCLGGLIVLWVILGFLSPHMEVTHVIKGTAMDSVMGTVKVTAAREVTVKTQADGKLSFISKLGPSGTLPLKSGEAFAQQDTSELDREIGLYQEKQSTLKNRIAIGSDQEIEIANARTDLGVAETLYKSGQYAQNDLEKKKRDLERLERDWQKERLDLDRELSDATYECQTRQDRRDKMTLRSPMDGVMCEIYAVAGQILTPEAPVALVRSNELKIDVSLDEEDFPGVAVGQRSTLSFTGINQTFSGHVSELSAFSNPDTRRRSAYVTLDKPNSQIVPGSTGYATIVKAEKKQAIIIPRRALFGDSVYVLQFGSLHRRKVELGYQSFATVEVTKGLSDWDSVALSGSHDIEDGMRINADWVQE